MFEAAANSATGAGVNVMVLVTGANARPHWSVAVHVSVIVPPHAPGIGPENVDWFEIPVIRQFPDKPLV